MKTTRPWTRSEKGLFLIPLLFVVASGAIFLWNKARPIFIEVPGANDFRALEFSPDGNRLAVFYTDSTRSKNIGQIYDLESREKVCDLTPPPSVSLNPKFGAGQPYYNWPSWSPDGTQIVAGYENNTRGFTKIPNRYRLRKSDPLYHFNFIGNIALWDAKRGNLRGNWFYAPPTEESYSGVGFPPDGKTLIGFGSPPSTFDPLTGRRLRVFTGTFKKASKGQANDKLGLLAVENQDLTRFQVVESKTNRVLFEPHIGIIDTFKWCDDVLGIIDESNSRPGRRSRGGSRLLLWDGKTRALLPSPPLLFDGTIYELSFNPDKKSVAFSNCQFRGPKGEPKMIESELVVWNYRLGRVMWRYPANSLLRQIHWSPDGSRLSMVADHSSTSLSANRLRVFDRSGKLCLEREAGSILTRWSPDSRYLAVSETTKSSGRIEIIRMNKMVDKP